ncbi:hypothetical protein H2198_003423 [Neophaeococcomyces mojaviensis]|uniref:Uncharacterized protein n=1 Tax=Neophaeococcomyces mojaviensis TaxID=3383035 RepID=A0ACC3ABH3_9EURO|nr:hypothetical protein H2198_003423 [Knufia sp. JES_112]
MDLEQIEQILALTHRLTTFWTKIVTTQKAIAYLSTVLGSNHTQVLALQQALKKRENRWRQASYGHKPTDQSGSDDLEPVRDRLLEATAEDSLKRTLTVAAACEHVPVSQTGALENSRVLTSSTAEAANARMSHRTKLFFGAMFSFGGHLQRAEDLLAQVQASPDVEVCPENKIHSLLFYAEHNTRKGDWHATKSIMRKLGGMWRDKTQPLPDSLKRYLRPRIKNILQAIASHLTCDDASNYGLVASNVHQGSPVPSLASSLTSSSVESEIFSDNPATPTISRASRSPNFMSVTSPESLGTDFWNDALHSPSPTAGKGLGCSLTQLSLQEGATADLPPLSSSLRPQPLPSISSPSMLRSPTREFDTALQATDQNNNASAGPSSAPRLHEPADGLLASEAQSNIDMAEMPAVSQPSDEGWVFDFFFPQ